MAMFSEAVTLTASHQGNEAPPHNYEGSGWQATYPLCRMVRCIGGPHNVVVEVGP